MIRPRQIPDSRPADSPEFVFREVRTAEELRAVLALRYEVYCDTVGPTRLSSLDPVSGLDGDCFDPWSRHFALFARQACDEQVVGTLRITSEERSPLASTLLRIGSEHPALGERFRAERAEPLPMFSYLKQAASVRAVHDRLNARGLKLAEPGRLTVRPVMRAAAMRRGLRLSHFLVECAQATAWFVWGLDHVIMDCDVRLEAFYRRFGFEPVEGVSASYQPTLDITFTVLQAAPTSLPEPLRPRVEALAHQIRETGEAVMDGSSHAVVSYEAAPLVKAEGEPAVVPIARRPIFEPPHLTLPIPCPSPAF